MNNNPLSSTTASATTTPFQSIFLSTTRPIVQKTCSSSSSCDNSNNNYNNLYKPFIILFQHSTKLHQRILSSEPSSSTASTTSTVSDNNNTNTNEISLSKEINIKNNIGSRLFVQQALKECNKRCNGHVIFIQLLPSSLISLSLSNNIINNDDQQRNSSKSELVSFYQNGVVIDLCSDPLGWDDDDDENNHDNKTVTTFKGRINDFQSILTCMEKAAQYIYGKKVINNNKSNHDEQQPIPIIFDSISPFLIQHGMNQFILFLSNLKQLQIKKLHSSHNDHDNNNSKIIITSPIFIPTALECTSPTSNQILEEYADTLMTLHHGKVYIAKRSSRGNGGMMYPGFSGGVRLVKDIQHFEVDWNRNSLILLNDHVSSASNSRGNDQESGSIGKVNDDLEKMKLKSTTMAHTAKDHTVRSSYHHTNKRGPIVLQHEKEEENDNDKKLNAIGEEATLKPTPRIYMEENDPEYEDYDEEDPDDDLDI